MDEENESDSHSLPSNVHQGRFGPSWPGGARRPYWESLLAVSHPLRFSTIVRTSIKTSCFISTSSPCNRKTRSSPLGINQLAIDTTIPKVLKSTAAVAQSTIPVTRVSPRRKPGKQPRQQNLSAGYRVHNAVQARGQDFFPFKKLTAEIYQRVCGYLLPYASTTVSVTELRRCVLPVSPCTVTAENEL